MSAQVGMFAPTPVDEPVGLTLDDIVRIWSDHMAIVKSTKTARIQTVFDAFPVGKREAVAMATIMVGGIAGWREAALGQSATATSGGRLDELKTRFLRHYTAETERAS